MPQPALCKLTIVDECVNRKKLYSTHTEAGKVIDDGGGREGGVSSAQMRGDVRVLESETLYMGLINDGAMPRSFGRAIRSPGEGGIDHDGLQHSGGAVAAIE